jgi:adenylate kinase family enzyme
MRRIAVVGGSCAGKTTAARALAERLGVPHVELDALHHGPGWQEASAEVLRGRVESALAAAPDGWVVDGNYHGKLGTLVLERADAAVWLDPPFAVALARVLRRTVVRIVGGSELWNGNRETLRSALSRRSIVWWVVRTHHRYGRLIPERLAAVPGLRVVRLRSAAEVRAFVQSIQATDPMSGSSKGSERQKTPPLAET